MNIVCLDLEGVLVPEIWIAFSSQSGIPELRRTTRDEPDYEKLMRWRLAILKEHAADNPVQLTGHQRRRLYFRFQAPLQGHETHNRPRAAVDRL